MRIYRVLKPVFVNGYAASDKSLLTMFVCLCMALIFGFYICAVYKKVSRQAFYNRHFALSITVLAVITAAIILTIQSNIVVSLGMVGALSIVRFRTAIKDPLDLIFLFWAIGTGIICGAGYAMIALILLVIVTVAIFGFERVGKPREDAMILVVDAQSAEDEDDIMTTIAQSVPYYKVQAKSATRQGLNLSVEVRLGEKNIIRELLEKPTVLSASLVRSDGEISAL